MYVNRCCKFRGQKCDIKETEKILKYKDLTIEIQRKRNVKTKVILLTIGATGIISKVMPVIIGATGIISMVIPVIIGATGIISKSFRKYVNNIT